VQEQQAEPLYTQALEMRQRRLGDDHPHVAASLNNLANALLLSGAVRRSRTPLYSGFGNLRSRSWCQSSQHNDDSQKFRKYALLVNKTECRQERFESLG